MRKIRIAMLTPSSNSVVEPWCYELAKSQTDTSIHFGRVEVLWIDDDPGSLSQFQDENILRGFDLLSHVKPSVIGWNGTSASWLGLDRDRLLAEEIYKRTGCQVVTASLSILEALKALKVTNIGFVTPYVGSIQKKIIANFRLEGFECVSERHFELTDNFSFGEISEIEISCAAEEVINEGAEAVVILCTNLAGAGIARIVEEKTGVPVLDSVVLTVWGAFKSIGKETSWLSEWAPAVSKLPKSMH
ncbi:MAG: Asp/Glu/hydantoin racemase [Rhodobacteraceae bacterium]|nr:aspartate/glutamate racemase family protein [Paracoccaceae bacterium]MYE36270.1 Asp/Glu/hydantoin racemase [Paracoccaceae bacterium]